MLFKGHSTWANSTSDAFLQDFWIFRFLKNPEIGIPENPDFWDFRKFRNPISESPDFRESENPDFQISGIPNLRTSRFSGNLKIQFSRFPGHRMWNFPGHPMSGIGGVRTHQRNMATLDDGNPTYAPLATWCFP